MNRVSLWTKLWCSNWVLMCLVFSLATAYVELENSTYVVTEGEGNLEVCLRAKGYNFSFELTSTYDNVSKGD